MSINKKIFLYWFFCCSLLSKLVGIGFLFFVNAIPAPMPVSYKINTDAIIVLTGGRKRIETGIELLKQNPTKILFISGVNPKIKKIPKVIKVASLLPQTLKGSIQFGQNAKSTFENALETKTWLRSHQIKSITLVTAAYHMPRSILEFTEVMPDVTLKYYPVFPAGFKVGQWWLHPRSAILLFKEYCKYLGAHTRIWLERVYARFI